MSKDALIEAGWGGLAVADNNLTVQIAALRRVLAEAADAATWIETMPRRGYRYIGPAVVTDVPDMPAIARAASALALPEKPSVAVLPFSNLSGDLLVRVLLPRNEFSRRSLRGLDAASSA